MGGYLERGAVWRKWDLHVHTPSSYDYKDKSVSNTSIIDILANNHVSVVAITDHGCIDITRIRDLQEIGEKKGITVLPGIEFLSSTIGKEPVHFVGIFSTDCNLQYVWDQLRAKTNLSKIEGEGKKPDEVYCDLFSTADLIHELGGIVTIHAGKKSNSLENVTHALPHGCAQKEDIAKVVDFFELGKVADVEEYKNIVIKFIEAKTNKTHPLLLCSDNHNIKEYVLKENLWIKADPTFEGLRQVINEPEERVYIGSKPELYDRVEKNRTKYIKEIKIAPNSGYDNRYGKWFTDISIPVNSELVAIIGNKGSGKSALADIVALCSNFQNQNDFSFLNARKFRDGKHDKSFNASIIWESGTETKKGLDESSVAGSIEEVKYLPQGQFERLTNEITTAKEFQGEIEKVVFAHLDDSERMGATTFRELIETSKRVVETEIKTFIDSLEPINIKIIELERKQSNLYQSGLKSKLKKKNEELQALVEPPVVSDPNEDPEKKAESEEIIARIDVLKEEILKVEKLKSDTLLEKGSLLLELKMLKDTKREIETKVQELIDFIVEKKASLAAFDIEWDKVISIKFDITSIDSILKVKEDRLLTVKNILGEAAAPSQGENLDDTLNSVKDKLKKEQDQLGTEQRKYQDYLKSCESWKKAKEEIVGNKDTVDSIEFLNDQISYIVNVLPSDLETLYSSRRGLVKNIFKKKQEVIDIYRTVKKRIDDIILSKAAILSDYKISINASLVLSTNFSVKFFSFINQAKGGTFYSKEGADQQLKKLLSGINFDDVESVVKFLDSIIESLKHDQREKQEKAERYITDQIEDVYSFYSYLFSMQYLDYNYQLKQGEKLIEQLSPGERGALLLVFYLLLDKNDVPLIIDQPEDNLDNHSVASILVPFIRAAKSKRQIIMVTHNPNLAIVSDSEQIIYVDINKEIDHTFSVEAGSIENPLVNDRIVKVLEGAMPAFNKRKSKYFDGFQSGSV